MLLVVGSAEGVSAGSRGPLIEEALPAGLSAGPWPIYFSASIKSQDPAFY